jgi:hypothetical protein
MLHNTGQKGASSAKFAIREPQPAALSLRAGLQQLRGAAGSSQMQGGGGCPTEEAILIEAEDEQASMATPAPSLYRAALRTDTPAQGISHYIYFSHWAMLCKCCSRRPALQEVGFALTLYFSQKRPHCACIAVGEEQDNPKPGGGMSAQRKFLASVLRPGKRQQPSTVGQVSHTFP